jgi:hypothetical protein
VRGAGGSRRGRNGNLRIDDFRFQIAHSGEPVPCFFGKNLTSKGNTWRTKAFTVLVEMLPAVCEIEAAAGSSASFGWRLTALRMTNRMKNQKMTNKVKNQETTHRNEGPKTVDQEQIILALFPRPFTLPASLLSPSLYFPGPFSFPASLVSHALLCQA